MEVRQAQVLHGNDSGPVMEAQTRISSFSNSTKKEDGIVWKPAPVPGMA